LAQPIQLEGRTLHEDAFQAWSATAAAFDDVETQTLKKDIGLGAPLNRVELRNWPVAP